MNVSIDAAHIVTPGVKIVKHPVAGQGHVVVFLLVYSLWIRISDVLFLVHADVVDHHQDHVGSGHRLNYKRPVTINI